MHSPPPSAEPTLSRPVRILILTAALALTGGVIGAVLGALVSSLGPLALSPMQIALVPGLIWFGVYVGAIIGAILAPLTGWLLLRRVPLGLAVGETAVGAVSGAIIGLIAGGGTGSVMFAIAGFVSSAVLLRLTAGRACERAATFTARA